MDYSSDSEEEKCLRLHENQESGDELLLRRLDEFEELVELLRCGLDARFTALLSTISRIETHLDTLTLRLTEVQLMTRGLP